MSHGWITPANIQVATTEGSCSHSCAFGHSRLCSPLALSAESEISSGRNGDHPQALKPTKEQRWNPLIGLFVSGVIACLLMATIGPNPLLVAYLMFALLVWVLLSTGVLDQ